MNKILLTGLVLACGMGCKASTIIGGADGGCEASYPENGFYGPNILYPGVTSIAAQPFLATDASPMYELVATHPLGATVEVKITLLSGSVWYIGGSANDWRATLYDTTTGEQTFETPNVAGESESSIFFVRSGQARLDILECGSATPTSSKTLTWSSGDAAIPGIDGSVGDAAGTILHADAALPGFDAAPGNGHD